MGVVHHSVIQFVDCLRRWLVSSEMSAHTQLSDKEMRRTLQSLVDVKLLVQSGTVSISIIIFIYNYILFTNK